MNDKKLVFMTTPFRSGSTLLSKILTAHSRVTALNDSLKFFCFCYNRYLPLSEENIRRLLEEQSYRLLNRFNVKIDVAECLQAIQRYPLSQALIYRTILRHIFKEHSAADIILDKEPLAWTRIAVFLQWFPQGKALLIIRDPRDVVVSFKKFTCAPGNDYLIALFNVIDAMDHFLELEQTYPGRFYGVRYERLKQDPQTEVKKISAFLGIDYDSKMLDEDNWTDEQGRKWENQKRSAFYPQGDYLNPMGRWRRLITEEELFLCEWIGKKQMQGFGMEFENRAVSDAVLKRALEMVTSSGLLCECFSRWCRTGRGVERYPLDPRDPAHWNRKEMHNPEAFGVKC